MSEKNKKINDMLVDGFNNEELESGIEIEDDTVQHNDEELEYEFELIMDTAARLGDLSMALCHYDESVAKQALGIALGTLCGEYNDEEPCLHKVSELAELQMNHVLEHIAKHHDQDIEVKNKIDKPLN